MIIVRPRHFLTLFGSLTILEGHTALGSPPSQQPSWSFFPSGTPSESPSWSFFPSTSPTISSLYAPSDQSSLPPSNAPSNVPTQSVNPAFPSTSYFPSNSPSMTPSHLPTGVPPSDEPTSSYLPTPMPSFPSQYPSDTTSLAPSEQPSWSFFPSVTPTEASTTGPSISPSFSPSDEPSQMDLCTIPLANLSIVCDVLHSTIYYVIVWTEEDAMGQFLEVSPVIMAESNTLTEPVALFGQDIVLSPKDKTNLLSVIVPVENTGLDSYIFKISFMGTAKGGGQDSRECFGTISTKCSPLTETPIASPSSPTLQPSLEAPAIPTEVKTKFPTFQGCEQKCLDFNDKGLTNGQYIYDDLSTEYCVKIVAKASGESGYTPIEGKHTSPGGSARIYDTGNPNNCDMDLMTPSPKFFSGPDVNCMDCCGGAPFLATFDKATETCVELVPQIPNPYINNKPLGNALIIQQKGKNETDLCPNDSWQGGSITFEFCQDIIFESAQLLDAEEGTSMEVSYSNPDITPVSWVVPNTGDNGVFSGSFGNEEYVSKVTVHFPKSGAVSELCYQVCDLEPTSAPLSTYDPISSSPPSDPTIPPKEEKCVCDTPTDVPPSSVSCMKNESSIHLSFTFDAFPSDISWAFVEGDGEGAVISGGSGYGDNLRGSLLEVPMFCVPTNGCYTFVIRDSQGDGLCCGAGEGNYNLDVDDGLDGFKGGIFSFRESVQLCVGGEVA